jgi:hypothetical protein
MDVQMKVIDLEFFILSIPVNFFLAIKGQIATYDMSWHHASG